MRSRLPSPCASTGVDGVGGGDTHQTAAATTKLITPAIRRVPGSPAAGTSTKPLTNTPAAAPRLLVK